MYANDEFDERYDGGGHDGDDGRRHDVRGMMGGNIITPWWILGWLLVIAVTAAVVLVVAWAIRRPGRADQPGDTPLTILKRRYAAGEVDQAQFEKMKLQLNEI